MDKNNHLTINVPNGQESIVQDFENRCTMNKLSVSQVTIELYKRYLRENIYIPNYQEDQDVAANNFIERFKRFCPNWPIPKMHPALIKQIAQAALRESPEWWEDLFERANDTPPNPYFQIDFLWLLNQDNCFKIKSGRYGSRKAREEHEKRAEERRLKRETERLEKERLKKEEAERKAEKKAKDLAEKQRIKQEEAERKAKEKEEKERLKHPELAEAKEKEEERERLEKERQERLEKAKHEPQWNEIAYIDETTGREIGEWVYPNDWTDEQIVDWELAHEK
jgi:primosomal protein N'